MDSSYEANHDIGSESQDRGIMHPEMCTGSGIRTPEERRADRQAAKHDFETNTPAHSTPREELEIAVAHLILEKLNLKFLTDTANSNLGDWKTLYNLLVQERENCKDRISSLIEFLDI